MFVTDITAVVLDLETTGLSPERCRITEVGAVRLRAGQAADTFQTLVNPAIDLPIDVTLLTGITARMVRSAPALPAVFDRILDFVADAVVVGHNVAFDVAFLNVAAARLGRPSLTNPTLDTRDVARAVIGTGLCDFRLAAVADFLAVEHRPTHRALADAWATADVLCALADRVGGALPDLIRPAGVLPVRRLSA